MLYIGCSNGKTPYQRGPSHCTCLGHVTVCHVMSRHCSLPWVTKKHNQPLPVCLSSPLSPTRSPSPPFAPLPLLHLILYLSISLLLQCLFPRPLFPFLSSLFAHLFFSSSSQLLSSIHFFPTPFFIHFGFLSDSH